MKTALEFWAEQLRAAFEICFAPYNQVEQTLLDPVGALAANEHGLNVAAVRTEDLGADPQRARSNVAHLREALRSARLRAPLLVCLCPPSRAVAGDPAWREAERALMAPVAGVEFLHYDEVREFYPVDDYEPPAILGHVPYTETYFAALGTVLARRAHARMRAPFKAIALDCDDTLWSGICGEDGPGGVALDPPRRALQEFMRRRREAGMLLAIVSKNNEADVVEAFEGMPDAPLQLGHFAARRINWSPKEDNLSEIARELNLGLDSVIFVDDNPKECAEVESGAPEVLCVPLPPDAEQFAHFLRHVWAFDSPPLTAEDRKRAESYDHARRFGDEMRRAANLEKFMAGLRLRVRIEPLKPERAERVAQLPPRTTQFNFTGVRRTAAEILGLAGDGYDVLTAEVSDRFGDYGLVGVTILRGDEIDTMLLSCRALGRGVEHRMLGFLAGLGRETIMARLRPTAKNAPALQFLESLGVTGEVETGGDILFRFPAASLRGLEWKPSPAPAASLAAPLRDEAPPDRPDYVRIARELSTPEQIVAGMRRRHRSGAAAAPADPAATETERRLSEIWSELLRAPSISASDNFFDLGGHSLLAVLLLTRVQETFGVELAIDDVYTSGLTLAGLAARIEELRLGGADSSEYAALLKEIEEMSEEEARQALAEEEADSGST